MKKSFVTVLVLVALTGCAAKITASNERTVVVKSPSANPSAALNLAETECQKYGRHAQVNSKPTEDLQWVFDCVK